MAIKKMFHIIGWHPAVSTLIFDAVLSIDKQGFSQLQLVCCVTSISITLYSHSCLDFLLFSRHF